MATEFNKDDLRWMRQALELARRAEREHAEVPVGAVLVLDDVVIGSGMNRNIVDCDASAHSEIVCLRDAGQRLGNHRFPGATLYITLEPCVMCAGAIVHARVARVVYAATDPKTGAAGSVFDTLVSDRHNHRVDVSGGLLADESASMLQGFFKARR